MFPGASADPVFPPTLILKSLNLKTNDILDLIHEEDKIIITKHKNDKISLEERFKKYN